MTDRRKFQLYLFALIAPLGLAFYSQFVESYHPCELCIVQRWEYAAAILFLLLSIKWKFFMKLSLLALFAGFITAFYHTGIEMKWWEGFQSCSNSFDSKMTIEEIRNIIDAAPAVRCDQATWILFGLSMAAWNAIYSAVIFLWATLVWRQKFI